MDLGLADRVYLVTGGGRGLGRATLEVLVAEGARVVVSGRSQASLDDAVRGREQQVVAVSADNADPGTPSRLMAAAHEHWGRLDGVMVSVGGPTPGGVLDVTDDDWRTAFDAVFLGGLRLARDVGRELGEGGSVLMVLSTSVRVPISGLAISNGLRPGLAMTAKQLADELGPQGVRVNGLLPGRVHTERIDELDARGGHPEAAAAAARASIPLGRDGQPDEFGRVAAFLLSPAASFVSGSVLPVDGGMTRAL